MNDDTPAPRLRSRHANRLCHIADALPDSHPYEFRHWLYELADRIELVAGRRFWDSVFADPWWEQALQVEGGCPL